MSFQKTYTPQSYSPAPPPVIPGAERIHYERELQRISQAIEALKQSVTELQGYSEANDFSNASNLTSGSVPAARLAGQDYTINNLTANQSNLVNQPFFFLDGNNTANINFAVGDQLLRGFLVSQIHNIGGFTWNSSTGFVTVPQSGTYLCVVNLFIQAAAGRFDVFRSGVRVGFLDRFNQSLDETGSVNASFLVRASAGDSFNVSCSLAPAGVVSIFSGPSHTMFQLAKIA